MNEDNLFDIQTTRVNEQIESIKFDIQITQVNEQIEFIRWIAENHDELIRALRAKVATKNADYFNSGKNAEEIFRGQYIGQYCNQYVREQLA